LHHLTGLCFIDIFQHSYIISLPVTLFSKPETDDSLTEFSLLYFGGFSYKYSFRFQEFFLKKIF